MPEPPGLSAATCSGQTHVIHPPWEISRRMSPASIRPLPLLSATFPTLDDYANTYLQYDSNGNLTRTVSPEGTITRTVYDGQGRAVSEWVGTDDTPTTGYWSPTNTSGTNLVDVADYEYDGGGVGDGNRTKVTAHPGGRAADRVTQTWFDWRDRAVAVKSGVETSESTSVNRPLVVTTYDNLGEVTETQMYDGDG